MIEVLEGLGFEPEWAFMRSLWIWYDDANELVDFIHTVMEDQEFNEIGIFVTDNGEWRNIVDLEASCPRVFPPFVVQTQ